MSPAPRNPMDRTDLYVSKGRSSTESTEGESKNDPDKDHLNGRPTAEHEQALVLEARRAEREEAAAGILSGLIRTVKL